MPVFTVITENDESQWDDLTGVRYHYPTRYLALLPVGAKVIYYKGKLRDNQFRDRRASAQPHYFGIAEIGQSTPVGRGKGYYADILNFQRFEEPVLAKHNGEYLEAIPPNRLSNYWRDGVRAIDENTFNTIVGLATLRPAVPFFDNDTELGVPEPSDAPIELVSGIEGRAIQRMVTTYERCPELRRKAIEIHGTKCRVCGFEFEKAYGALGKGYIQVHHLIPVSEAGETEVNPERDLAPVCANCHCMLHRRRGVTLSIAELQKVVLLNKSRERPI